MTQPYSRLYWRFRDEYPDVYQDKEVFGWFVSLLINAEGAHPSAADLPKRVKQRAIKQLVAAELLELLPGDRYRIRGLTKERERRTEAARVGGLASGRSRTPGTTVEQTLNDRSKHIEPRRDETRRAKTRQDEHAENGLKPIGALLPGVVERLLS